MLSVCMILVAAVRQPNSSIPDKIYGGLENSGQNTEGTGDVVFKVAQNGYYLYVYLVFSNGGIACYQYDCIDM